MTDLKIIWEDDALRLLDNRDRYERRAIQDEFREDPRRNAIPVDASTCEFVTQVSNKRFSVVWQLDETRRQAIVRAVVPLANVNAGGAGLKEYVQRAVEQEIKR